MKSFDEIFALAMPTSHREYAETFTDHRLSWGVGVAQGVAVAMQETQAEIDALKAQNAELLAALEWQSIESAPKDGTRILVYAADTREIFSVSWMTAQEDGSQEWIAFRFDQIGAVAIHNATLWQPMPWPELARGDL